jgi:DNA-binding Xre family transcriptional regulator
LVVSNHSVGTIALVGAARAPMSKDSDELDADWSTGDRADRPAITPNEQIGHEQYRSEPALRAALAQRLRDNGLAIEENVSCPAGVADIITISGDALFEVKHRLTRKQVYTAVGQILLYRESINPQARAILAGYSSPEIFALMPFLASLGIEVMFWQDTPEMPLHRGEASSIPLAPNPDRHALVWAVQERAIAQGLSSVRALSFKARVPRQSIYPLWQGKSKSASLDMLERLAKALNARPGQWFGWEGAEDARSMVWNIRNIAEARSITQAELVWLTGILPNSLAPIWRGEAKAVFVTTLTRLAHALDLDIGDLFAWSNREGTD